MSSLGRVCDSTYFIADLHLDPAHPQTCALALNFFQQVHGAKALYILGDLFEYWVGDDSGIALYQDVITALATLSRSGCELCVMLGNRDFLLGEDFAQAAGAQLVREDELVLTIDAKPVLLMHGDTLCVDDTDYQTFRAQVRDQQWQQAFLDKPVQERIAYAEQLRGQSRHLSAAKTPELMDVNIGQVQSRLAVHGCRTLIHGHTHKPQVHRDEAPETRRFVVGDWHPAHAQFVARDEKGLQLRTFSA